MRKMQLRGNGGYARTRWGGWLAICLSLLLLAGSVAGPAVAAEPASPGISINQAISMALAQSEQVKKAAREVDRTGELRKEAASKLDYTPVGPVDHPLTQMAYSNILAQDLSWRMSSRSLTAQQDAVALEACKRYWDVLLAQEKVKAAEAARASAKKQAQDARACYQVGTLAIGVQMLSEAQLSGAQASLVAVSNELEKAYTAFNQLVGLWPQERPALTDTVTFTPLDITSLDYEVTRVLENCPTVWLAEERVTMQKFLEDMMFYTGEYRPYEARKIEVEQAQLDAASVKKQFEQATRSMYYGIGSLEEAYVGAQEGVRAAEENHRVTQLKFKLGMATATEVAAANQSLAQAQARCFEIACNHAYLKLSFQKPWAVSAGASGSGGMSSTASY